MKKSRYSLVFIFCLSVPLSNASHLLLGKPKDFIINPESSPGLITLFETVEELTDNGDNLLIKDFKKILESTPARLTQLNAKMATSFQQRQPERDILKEGINPCRLFSLFLTLNYYGSVRVYDAIYDILTRKDKEAQLLRSFLTTQPFRLPPGKGFITELKEWIPGHRAATQLCSFVSSYTSSISRTVAKLPWPVKLSFLPALIKGQQCENAQYVTADHQLTGYAIVGDCNISFSVYDHEEAAQDWLWRYPNVLHLYQNLSVTLSAQCNHWLQNMTTVDCNPIPPASCPTSAPFVYTTDMPTITPTATIDIAATPSATDASTADMPTNNTDITPFAQQRCDSASGYSLSTVVAVGAGCSLVTLAIATPVTCLIIKYRNSRRATQLQARYQRHQDEDDSEHCELRTDQS